ncbi:hypothetical protein IEQ34_001415 [Dendrobium chrysotoxum]|uniref:Uncharacterized protein n=1 Tax=Dendrobium chrysotoxum TaxID=161865 RepID=A0AAV7HLS1_DENCH|nr:hypothetical protein IEQ34_001415 [Dendrobium chrysotoxum]
MMYYGMPLSLVNLNSNLYISVALNVVAELLSTFIVFFLAYVITRWISKVGLTALTGSFSLACIAMRGGGWSEIVLELVDFFGACTMFNTLMIYIVELFPTCVRNLATVVVRQAVMLSGLASPAW